MQSIYICEDDSNQLKELKEIIEQYILIENLEMEVVLASQHPDVLIQAIESSPPSKGIYFLDIDLNHEMDGLQLAQRIRQVDDLGRIIFVTTHAELAPVTFRYKVEALDYIVKDSYEQLQKQIIDVLNIIVERQPLNAEAKRQFVFQSGSKTRSVDYDSIIYFESLPQPHKIGLNTTYGHYQFYDSLKAIEQVDENFVRVHKSYIAHLPMIESVDRNRQMISFIDGSSCPLSPRRAKHLVKLIKEQD